MVTTIFTPGFDLSTILIPLSPISRIQVVFCPDSTLWLIFVTACVMLSGTLIRGNEAILIESNLNNYFSATECPIDLKPSCIFKFVPVFKPYLSKKWIFCLIFVPIYKMGQFGPWRDPGGAFIGKGPPKSASQGQF